MDNYKYKITNFLFNQLPNINKATVLELGVREGRSTKNFLNYCKKNNGKLYSIDIHDYSSLFKNPRWKFILSWDDNFKYLDKILPKSIDILYIDSLHEADHVEKIFYYYYKKLTVNGLIFIDDISWLPYLKDQNRNNFYCETNNKETFDRILSIYLSNYKNFDLNFNFFSSGICKITKKKNILNLKAKINTREFSLKNLVRKLIKKIKY